MGELSLSYLLEAAYQDQVKLSFHVLVTSLSGGDGGGAYERFTHSVELAAAARDKAIEMLNAKAVRQ